MSISLIIQFLVVIKIIILIYFFVGMNVLPINYLLLLILRD